MKIIIVGRTLTGKTTLLEKLKSDYGVPVLKSCTTRPKRYPGEDSYYFFTKETAAKIPDKDKILKTTLLDDHERWTMPVDLDYATAMILDPKGFFEACPIIFERTGEIVHLIYVRSSKDASRQHAKIAAQFDARYEKENDQFDEFEKTLRNIDDNNWPENVRSMQCYDNDFSEKKLNDAARAVASVLHRHANRRGLVTDAILNVPEMFTLPQTTPDKIRVTTTSGEEKQMSIDQFAHDTFEQPDDLHSFIDAYMLYKTSASGVKSPMSECRSED